MRTFFSRLSIKWLLALTILAGLAPWPVGPEPHLVQKLRWLADGSLTRPIDIFDLAFHAAPAILLCAKILADLTRTE